MQYERSLLLVRCIRRLGEVGTGHRQTAAQICGEVDLLPPLQMPRSCVVVVVVVVVRLGVLNWPWLQLTDDGLGEVTIVVLCLSANTRVYKVESID